MRTQNAWQRLFPGICRGLCFLHAVLQIGERGVRNLPLHTSLVDKAGSVYEAVTRAQFSQRLRRFREWGLKHKSLGPLRDAVLSLCNKGPRFACLPATGASTAPLTPWTGGWMLRYFHGTLESARGEFLSLGGPDVP